MAHPFQKHLNTIRRELKQHITNDPHYKAFREKTTNLTCWGLRVPRTRSVLQTLSFLKKDPDHALDICDHVWRNASVHEVMSVVLYHLNTLPHPDTKKLWRVTKHWIDRIENWEHSDNLSYLYSRLLELHPKLVYPTLKKWNTSKNPWKRRNSIVPLIYYASKKRTPPPVDQILPLVKNLLSDADDYVQKGIGWTLRECGNIYPKETLAFLKKHILDLSAIAFSYSTEKLTPAQKAPLKKKREQHRKRSTKTR